MESLHVVTLPNTKRGQELPPKTHTGSPLEQEHKRNPNQKFLEQNWWENFYLEENSLRSTSGNLLVGTNFTSAIYLITLNKVN